MSRTVVSALDPWRYEDDYTAIFMRVWFEEFDGWLPFVASPFDCERHGKELWIRAMAGEYGEIKIIAPPIIPDQKTLLPVPPKLLTYQGDQA